MSFISGPLSENVPPSSSSLTLSGGGTATYTVDYCAFSVSNGVLSLWAGITITADGNGVADVELSIPGGYSLKTSLISGAAALLGSGSAGTVLIPGSTAARLLVSPLTGSDLANGTVYNFRAVFPIV